MRGNLEYPRSFASVVARSKGVKVLGVQYEGPRTIIEQKERLIG